MLDLLITSQFWPLPKSNSADTGPSQKDHSKNQKGPPRLSRDGKGPAPGRVLEMAESSPDKFTYENKIAERFGGQKRVGASRADPIGNSIVRNERGRQLRRPLYSARKGADPFTFRSRAQHLRRRSAGDAARPLLTAGFWPLDLVSGDLGEGRPRLPACACKGSATSYSQWKTGRPPGKCAGHPGEHRMFISGGSCARGGQQVSRHQSRCVRRADLQENQLPKCR
jgi:hypothetical protein